MMMTVSKAGLAIQSHMPAKVRFREKPVGDNTSYLSLSIHVNHGICSCPRPRPNDREHGFVILASLRALRG